MSTFKSLHSLACLLLLFVLTVAGAGAGNYPCAEPSAFPFCNTSLPFPIRARSIISMLTLPEKISFLDTTASPVPRLSIPAYEWWSESLHGIAINGPGITFAPPIPAATQFPQVILSAASFNRTLFRIIGSSIAVEARAMHNHALAGLTFWAPNINIFRDPRWGRGQETPGEDPLLVSTYAVQYVLGFENQEADGSMMVSACCKHYSAYDLEKWGGFSRYDFDAVVTKQDNADTYEPPFRKCVEEGKASCLMCSYNAVNGVPACASGELLKKAREEWGFQGYITSDCDAVATIYEYQHYAASPEDAVSLALKAGTDINCGTYMVRHTAEALKLGKVSEDDIDRALFNLFSVQLRLGLFNGDPSKQRFGQLGPSDVCTKDHRKVALEAARQGIVLLKNDNGFLPLRKKAISSVAIIGPAADDTNILGGDYTGVACNPISFLKGLQEHVSQATFAPGCNDVPCESKDRFKEAINAAREADMVIVVAGLNLTEETEDHDRTSLLLPGKQMDLVNAIAGITKKPIVLVLMGGGPLDVSFAKKNSRIASMLWIGYPGEVGGQVLAEAIFGEFNPGGRLPVTWYPESFTKVPMNDMNMRPDPSRGYPGRTYRFYTGEVVYPFGYGLSYSKYSYKFLSAPATISLLGSSQKDKIERALTYDVKDGLDYVDIDEIKSCETLSFEVQISVANNGGVDGSHSVLLFSRSVANIRGSPQKQLIGFERVHTRCHEETETMISVDPCKHLSTVTEQGRRVISLGSHVLMLEDVEHVLSLEV